VLVSTDAVVEAGVPVKVGDASGAFPDKSSDTDLVILIITPHIDYIIYLY
jgi:hypothetical protein